MGSQLIHMNINEHDQKIMEMGEVKFCSDKSLSKSLSKRS